MTCIDVSQVKRASNLKHYSASEITFLPQSKLALKYFGTQMIYGNGRAYVRQKDADYIILSISPIPPGCWKRNTKYRNQFPFEFFEPFAQRPH